MGKEQRRGEPDSITNYLEALGILILGAIEGEGTLEGGDVVWIDEHTLAVGRGYRTNDEGIRQLTEITSGFVDTIISVALPHWNGPEEVLHLMSLMSPLDIDLVIVYSRLLPVPFASTSWTGGFTYLRCPMRNSTPWRAMSWRLPRESAS